MRNKIGWIFLALLGGCQPQLETGYVPRPLNANESDRRAFYAPAFTPEAHSTKDSGPGLEFAH